MLSHTIALRLATRLQAAWQTTHAQRPAYGHDWDHIKSYFAATGPVCERLAFAAARNFTVATERLVADLDWRLAELGRLIARLREPYAVRTITMPGLADWLADVRQLELEFGEVEVRWPETVLRVVTEPITLRDVDLGRFAIEFAWMPRTHSERTADAFTIHALDPNTAAGRDDVPHPHVQKNALCAGDALNPIRRALQQGRLTEAFVLVRAVLTTYNPASPYVTLEEWSGVECSDCGRRTEREEISFCEGCQSDLCDQCCSSCGVCEVTRCGECLDRCAICRGPCCRRCLETTEDHRTVCRECFAACLLCATRLPKDELTDERLCPDCDDPEPEEECDDADEVEDLAAAEPAAVA